MNGRHLVHWKTLLFVGLMLVGMSNQLGAEDWGMTPPDMFGGPEQGQAPNFVLQALGGETVELDAVVGEQPVVLEFGSYTCPVFRKKHPAMEELYAQYGDRAAFFTVYVIEPHPQDDPSPYTGEEWLTRDNQREGILYQQPTTEVARRAVATAARDGMNIQIPIVVDNMQNTTWEAYGSAPNAAYLIGTDGRVKLRQGWFKPRAFEQALIRELE